MVFSTKNNFGGHFISMLAYAVFVSLATYLLYAAEKIGARGSTSELLILELATFRLTNLFFFDSVSDHIRNYFGKISNNFGRAISELLNFPRRTGVWIAPFVGFFYLLSPLAYYPIFFVALAGIGSIFQIVSIYIMRLTPSQ